MGRAGRGKPAKAENGGTTYYLSTLKLTFADRFFHPAGIRSFESQRPPIGDLFQSRNRTTGELGRPEYSA